MSSTKSPLSNRAYDALKFAAQILLPAVAAGYFGLASVWHLPNAEQVVGTVTVVDTFLGVVLGLSTSKYNKNEGAPDGDLLVQQVDGETYLGLGVNRSVESLTSKDVVKLNVVADTSPPPAE